MINQGISKREYYERYYSSRDWRFYKNILSKVILLSEPGSILDVGAGTGFIVEGALRWGLDCVGIEGSVEAIEIAHKRYPRMNLIKHFLSERFPFPDETFQTVIINQTIEHLEPEVGENAIMESYRVLKAGGMIFVTSPNKFNRRAVKADPTHITAYSPKELQKLLISVGFQNIISMNSSLNLLGKSYLARALMNVFFKLTKWDRLSASANCVAYRPERPLQIF